MNKKVFIAFLILVVATIAYASEFAPRLFHSYSITKSLKYSVRNHQAVKVRGTADLSAYLNGKGDAWLIPANTSEDLSVFRNISSMTFKCTSTAAASPVTVRIQEQR